MDGPILQPPSLESERRLTSRLPANTPRPEDCIEPQPWACLCMCVYGLPVSSPSPTCNKRLRLGRVEGLLQPPVGSLCGITEWSTRANPDPCPAAPSGDLLHISARQQPPWGSDTVCHESTGLQEKKASVEPHNYTLCIFTQRQLSLFVSVSLTVGLYANVAPNITAAAGRKMINYCSEPQVIIVAPEARFMKRQTSKKKGVGEG